MDGWEGLDRVSTRDGIGPERNQTQYYSLKSPHPLCTEIASTTYLPPRSLRRKIRTIDRYLLDSADSLSCVLNTNACVMLVTMYTPMAELPFKCQNTLSIISFPWNAFK